MESPINYVGGSEASLSVTSSGSLTGPDVQSPESGVNVAAGFSEEGDISNSHVVSEGGISKIVALVGGHAYAGNSTNNSVTIKGGTISVGYEYSMVSGITGGSANSSSFDYSSSVEEVVVSGNKVNITAGTVQAVALAGGIAAVDDDQNSVSSASATGNTVEISGGAVVSEFIVGGVAQTFEEDEVSATGNTVKITGGTVTGGIVAGGAVMTGGVAGTASDNTVILGSGKYVQVYGGFLGGLGSATGNTICVFGDTDLSEATVSGGGNPQMDQMPASADTITVSGNKLVFGYEGNAWTRANPTINAVRNFSTIRFDAAVWGNTITVNSFANESTDSTVTKVDATNVAFSGVDALSAGMSYDMLTIGTVDSGSIALSSTESNYTLGTNLQGTGTVSLSEDGKTVTYTVTGGDTPALTALPQTHGVAMASAAMTSALSQGADTASAALSNLTILDETGGHAFFSLGGGGAYFDTGSHVSLKTANLLVGLGSNIATSRGRLSVGAGFETGYGKFKNSFDAGDADPYIHKKGNVSYYGLALLGNFEFDNLWHTNAAIRVGKSKTKQNNGLYDASTNQTYNYKFDSVYVGLELGGGKIFKLDDKNSVDVYAKYFFLHQGSDSFNAGGNYHVKAVKSHRLRVAGLYKHDFSKNASFYADVGGEYEFDGKAKLSLDNGVQAKAADCDGFRGYGKVGVTIVPEGAAGLSLDLSLKGKYGSKYREMMANAALKYRF